MKTELQQKITELETKFKELRSQVAAMPDEGKKWVPKVGDYIFYIAGDGGVAGVGCNTSQYIQDMIARGNCYPTEQAAIDAREQQDFIRSWLNAGDVPNDKPGYEVGFGVNGLSIDHCSGAWYGTPRFSTELKAREWVESHGGPDVVRDRLARGLV
jgi:hypothetical protein